MTLTSPNIRLLNLTEGSIMVVERFRPLCDISPHRPLSVILPPIYPIVFFPLPLKITAKGRFRPL